MWRVAHAVHFPHNARATLRAKLTDFDGRSGRSKKIRLSTSVFRALVAVNAGTSTRFLVDWQKSSELMSKFWSKSNQMQGSVDKREPFQTLMCRIVE